MKTVELNGSVGSNPTPSAINIRRDCREAEGARLLSECGAKVPPRVRIPVSPPVINHALAPVLSQISPVSSDSYSISYGIRKIRFIFILQLVNMRNSGYRTYTF